MLNRVYANVLNKPVLVPERRRDQSGLGDLRVSRRRRFQTVEEAQDALCPGVSRHRAASRAPCGLRANSIALYKQALLRVRPSRIAAAATAGMFCRRCGGSRRARRGGQMLEALRDEVLEANLELVRRGLVIYTFGNASGIDRATTG